MRPCAAAAAAAATSTSTSLCACETLRDIAARSRLKARQAARSTQGAMAAHPPENGERIMVFRGHWLLRILLKEKTLEVRGTRYAGKTYLLGCRGKIFARATFGEPVRISTLEQWRGLRSMHRVPGNELPYKKTWGLPLQELIAFRQPYDYTARRGAVGIAIFRGA